MSAMSLKTGLISCTRFTPAAPLPGNFAVVFHDCLQSAAFRDFFPENEEKFRGWTGLQEILDTEFASAHHSLGDYRVFSLRVDRKTVPGALLRLRLLEAERRLLAERGAKKLFKEEREALREGIRRELLKQAPPVPALFDVCWSLSRGTVYFLSLSEKILQDFQDLFHTSFALGIALRVPWTDPVGSSSPAGAATRREDEAPAASSPSRQTGREFLTWLWFKSEERNGRIALAPDEEVLLVFVRRLVLAAGIGDYAESVVCQGQHASLLEGKEALRQGKTVREARLSLEIDAATWEFTFKADLFQFQAMKLPAPAEEWGEEREAGAEGRLLERIMLMEKAMDTMDRLFEIYTALRESPSWSAEAARLTAWMNKK